MNPLPAFVLRYFSRLRYPWLVALTGALFGLDLLVPDVLPFADEILLGLATLGLATLLLATRRKERGPDDAPPASPPPAALDG